MLKYAARAEGNADVVLRGRAAQGKQVKQLCLVFCP
jgi:hypothetical protein